MIGVHVLHFHYEFLLREAGGIPVGVLYGDVQTGKNNCNAICFVVVPQPYSRGVGGTTDLSSKVYLTTLTMYYIHPLS